MTPLAEALAALDAAETPEDAVAAPMAVLHARLGNRTAHRAPGALPKGTRQFFVAGAFMVTPDKRYMMLVGNTDFPPEQERLCVPIDGGHPGWVIAHGKPLLLVDTRAHGEFKQYLKTARMGSAIYAPLLRGAECFGLIIVAAQAYGTFGAVHHAPLLDLAPMVATRWDALGGPEWLKVEYAEATASGRAFFAEKDGMK